MDVPRYGGYAKVTCAQQKMSERDVLKIRC